MQLFREEKDSIGTLSVPEQAYYGVQTLRGYNNFQITGEKMEPVFIYNIAKIKKAAAIANAKAGSISSSTAEAIFKACDEVICGKLDGEFITDAIQGGAGTTVNMNVNEVVANRATELVGGKRGEYLVHPNDAVNCAQSTNDVIPSAGKLTLLDLFSPMEEKLNALVDALDEKAVEFDRVIKMGRTQLQDAVPVRLGQEFSAFSAALKRDRARISASVESMKVLNLGGTAIGTSINVADGYIENVYPVLSQITGYSLKPADNLIDSTQNLDAFADFSASLKTFALDLIKICNDLRLMSSGPRAGLEEIFLPAMQNGSSIMPGKVNPVIPEVVTQVAYNVIGNDLTVSLSIQAGQFELNPYEPVIFFKLFESLKTLTGALDTFTVNCVKGIKANEEHLKELVSFSTGTVTALAPMLGYQKAADIAKEAIKRGMSIKSILLEKKIFIEKEIDKILDPFSMT